jgi:hypothetical protein
MLKNGEIRQLLNLTQYQQTRTTNYFKLATTFSLYSLALGSLHPIDSISNATCWCSLALLLLLPPPELGARRPSSLFLFLLRLVRVDDDPTGIISLAPTSRVRFSFWVFE